MLVIMGQLGRPPPQGHHVLPSPPWSDAYLVREVRGEGLGSEPLEEASGASSHCSSCSISSSSVRPPAGGQGSGVRGQYKGHRAKDKDHM